MNPALAAKKHRRDFEEIDFFVPLIQVTERRILILTVSNLNLAFDSELNLGQI
jgi:hypothetical protein